LLYTFWLDGEAMTFLLEIAGVDRRRLAPVFRFSRRPPFQLGIASQLALLITVYDRIFPRLANRMI